MPQNGRFGNNHNQGAGMHPPSLEPLGCVAQPACPARSYKAACGERMLTDSLLPLMLTLMLQYFGGISRGNPGPAGAGAVVFHNCPSKRKAARSKASSKPQDSGAQARKVQREPPVAVLKFKLPEDTTSNVAEYAALIMGLTVSEGDL